LKPRKVRADRLLVALGKAENRTRAQALIMAGKVFAGEQRVEKAGQLLDGGATLDLRGADHPWVSRGGVKLDHGLAHFGWDISGAVVADIGASTGGFTDVALSRGAARVYSVDVGHGQLDWRLREDPRVVALERTNARYLTAADIPEAPNLIVCDASFISLRTVLPAVMALAAPAARLMALIKPQFEVGRGLVGKGGVVRDAALREEVCADMSRWLAEGMGWEVEGVTESPITGPKGNVEYLIAARRPS